MTDETLINGSRNYDCCRYFDLVNRIEQFYADGQITDDELVRMGDMCSETLINYQVGISLLNNLDAQSKDRAKFTELVEYLRRCWQMMNHAYQRGLVANHDKSVNQTLDTVQSQKKKKLELNLDAEKTALVASLATTELRREANADYVEEQVKKLPPEVKEKASRNIMRALKTLSLEKINSAKKRMMDLTNIRD